MSTATAESKEPVVVELEKYAAAPMIVEASTNTSALLALADAQQVKSREDVGTAGDIGKSIRAAKKTLKDRWDVIFGPFEAHLDRIRGAILREPTKQLDAAYNAIVLRVNTFEAEERRKADEEARRRAAEEETRKKTEAELKKAGLEQDAIRKMAPPPVAAPAPAVHVGATRGETGGGFRTADEPFIESFDLAEIPLEFLLLDEKKVLAAWKGGRKEISGVVIKTRPKTRGL